MTTPTFDLDLGVNSQALCILRLLSDIPASFFCENVDMFNSSTRALYEPGYEGDLLISCKRGIASFEHFNVIIHGELEGEIKVTTFKSDAPIAEHVEISAHFEEEIFRPMDFAEVVNFINNEIQRFYGEEGIIEPITTPESQTETLNRAHPEGSYEAFIEHFEDNIKPNILKNSPTVNCTRGQQSGSYIYLTSWGIRVTIQRQKKGKYSVELFDYANCSDIKSMRDAKIWAETNLFYANEHWKKEREQCLKDGIVFVPSEFLACRINEEGKGEFCDLQVDSGLPNGDWRSIEDIAPLQNEYCKIQSVLGLSRHIMRTNLTVEPLAKDGFVEMHMMEVSWNESKRQWRSIFEETEKK